MKQRPTTEQHSNIQIPQLAARKRFGQYKKEEKKEIRKAEVKKDEKLEPILDRFRRVLDTPTHGFVPGQYKLCLSMLEGLQCTPGDVAKFSRMVVVFKNEENFDYKAGLFLSALVNHGRHRSYTLVTKDLGREVYRLGYWNTKNLIIDGDGGFCLGQEMIAGTVLVRGTAWRVGSGLRGGRITVEAGWDVGSEMEAGEIIVKEIAIMTIGKSMRGGRIIIEGDVRAEAGEGMKGGEIHLNGDCGKIATDIQGGKIYHKGKLIVDK